MNNVAAVQSFECDYSLCEIRPALFLWYGGVSLFAVVNQFLKVTTVSELHDKAEWRARIIEKWLFVRDDILLLDRG